MTQPRRVAARAAARRLAALDGTAVGERTGFTVRGESRAGAHTLIEFVTPGILLRRLLADPGLESASAVILDEVHERGLETDLLLGMLAEVRQLRPDLLLVAMSATLDTPRFAELLGVPGWLLRCWPTRPTTPGPQCGCRYQRAAATGSSASTMTARDFPRNCVDGCLNAFPRRGKPPAVTPATMVWVWHWLLK